MLTRSQNSQAETRSYAWRRRRSFGQRVVQGLGRIFGRGRMFQGKGAGKGQVVLAKLGPKRRAQLEQSNVTLLKKLAGYCLGLAIVGFSLFQASCLLAERGSEAGMVNVLLGLFTGIVVLFLISHDNAVARRQGL